MSLPHSVNMAKVPPRPLVPDRALGPLQLSVVKSARGPSQRPKDRGMSVVTVVTVAAQPASFPETVHHGKRSGVPRQTPTFSKKFQAAHVNRKRKERNGRGKKIMKPSATHWIDCRGGVTLHSLSE